MGKTLDAVETPRKLNQPIEVFAAPLKIAALTTPSHNKVDVATNSPEKDEVTERKSMNNIITEPVVPKRYDADITDASPVKTYSAENSGKSNNLNKP